MSDEAEWAIQRKQRGVDFGLFAPVVRDSDPITSHAAHDYIKAKRGTLAATLLQVYLAYGPMTDREASVKAGVESGWKRCSDLRKAGLIVPTGEERGTPPQMVCKAAGA